MMVYRSLFPRDVFTEFDRLQREVHNLFDQSPSIRGLGRGGYPALNVGSTSNSVEVYAFAPGIDPATIDVNLDRGVLTLSGERKAQTTQTTGNEQKGESQAAAQQTTVHLDERFAGRFRRVVNLPDDIDPNAVNATYADGVLHVSIQRRAAAQPRRIEIH